MKFYLKTCSRLSCSSSPEPFDFAKCEIVDSFQSRYVTSSFRSLKPGSTCESNSTSTSGQEVHVIMVNVPADKNGWLTVRLSILSRRMSNLKAHGHLRRGPHPSSVKMKLKCRCGDGLNNTRGCDGMLPSTIRVLPSSSGSTWRWGVNRLSPRTMAVTCFE
ncbi:hypothetical protein BgiBS90_028147 [Biomphalaria glabrata]|nr:hypothetical protein BgiBS90_028147 [Biomphalaria glabrata]